MELQALESRKIVPYIMKCIMYLDVGFREPNSGKRCLSGTEYKFPLVSFPVPPNRRPRSFSHYELQDSRVFHTQIPLLSIV